MSFAHAIVVKSFSTLIIKWAIASVIFTLTILHSQVSLGQFHKPGTLRNPEMIVDALERTYGHALTTEQVGVLSAAVRRAQELAANESVELSSRERSLLFCLGVNLAFVLQGGGATCVDTAGESYFLLTRGVGIQAGFAGEFFAFVVNHEANDTISPNFAEASVGSTTKNPIRNLKSIFGNLGSLLGPKIGLFYSLRSQQDGLAIGLRVGWLWEAGSIRNIDVFTTLDAMFASIKRMRIEIFPNTPEELRRQWKAPAR